LNTKQISDILDKLILSFLTLQIISVSLSIAVSSISFGIWGGLWIIQFFINKKIHYDEKIFRELRFFNYAVIFYFAAEIVSRIFAVNHDEAFTGLKRLFLFLIFYAAVIKVRDKKTVFVMLFINIFVLSLISVYELYEYVTRFEILIQEIDFSEIRIDYLNYPLTAGEIKMLSLFSILPLFFSKEKFFVKKIYLFLISLPVIISMLLTQSRNVFLAVAVCLFIYGIFLNRKFLLGFIISIILLWIFSPHQVKNRFESIFDPAHPSNETRFIIWEVGWQVFKDHPVTGVGDSKLNEVYKLYKEPERHGEATHFHNNFLMMLVTAGIPGFIAYLLMFIILFILMIKIYSKRYGENEKLLIFGSILVMISFQITGFFEWNFGDHEVMTVFFFLISVPFILYKIHPELKITAKSTN
jgi:O-antigen ligase